MPLENSGPNSGGKRKKRKRAVIIRAIDPAADTSTEEGFLDFFRSLIDAFIPSSGRGASGGGRSGAAGFTTHVESDEKDPGETGESSMADVAEMGAPILPAVLFIASILLLGTSFFTGNITKRLKIALFEQAAPNTLEPSARVWVNQASGTFYCADSVLYANGSGEYMEQGEALNMGYQPSLGTYCHGGQKVAPAKQSRARASNRNAAGGEESGGSKSDLSAPPPR